MPTLNGAALSCEDVLRAYSPLVYRLAWQSTGHPQDAEDVAQEVFVSLVRSNPSFRDETHLRAWLVRATINRSRTLAASAWRRHTVPLDPDWTAAGDVQEGAVLAAVAALAPKYRACVYLHYVEGYTAREIGQMLGCPKNTVLSRLMRARGQLKELLKEEFE